MRKAVGQIISEQTSFPISPSDIRKWAQAVYYPDAPPARYWDEDNEQVVLSGGLAAPEEFNPFAWMTTTGPRVRPAGFAHPELTIGVDPPGTSFQMNGGMEVTYSGVRMRPGDVIHSVSTITGYRERPGRLGLMLFTVSEDEWTNQRREMLKVSHFTLIRY
jgi:hypothetical protein